MRVCFLMIGLLISGSLLANVAQKVDGKRWAYYGEDFYRSHGSRVVTKEMITRILNAKHGSSAGKLDSIGSCAQECYQHVSIGYDGARQKLFGELYGQKDAGGYSVVEVYCGKTIRYRQVTDISHMSDQVNIEHTWPQSRFSSAFDKGMQKSDMHHLYPSDSKANSERGNYEFGNVDGMPNELRVENCTKSALADDTFQPPTSHRGNVARALFYFATHYNLPISKQQEEALRQWHKADPADAMEIKRHEIIAGYQKVRNPFVDHPELVDMIRDF